MLSILESDDIAQLDILSKIGEDINKFLFLAKIRSLIHIFFVRAKPRSLQWNSYRSYWQNCGLPKRGRAGPAMAEELLAVLREEQHRILQLPVLRRKHRD